MIKKFNSYIQDNTLIVAVSFFLILVLIESIFYNVEYVTFIRLFDNAEYSDLFIYIAFFILTSGLTILFIWTTLVSNYDYRFIYLLIFFLAISNEYSYLSIFDRFSTPADFYNAVFASDLQTKLDAIKAYFDWKAMIPCILFAILIVVAKPVIKRGWILFSLNVFLFVAVFSVSANFVFLNYHTNSLTAYYRTLIVSTWYLSNHSDFIVPREEPTYYSKETPDNNIVFIVDESVRADHLSLNGYERNTTPKLVELEKNGFLINWGIAVSATTESVNSNRVLLTGLNKFPDTTHRLYTMTSIFQYAKAMGYKNYYFDGQSNTSWNGTKYDTKDFGKITTVDDFKSEHTYDIDGEIGRNVSQIVSSSKGNFIWITKRGTHTPYTNHYPKNADIWNPIKYDANKFTGETKHIPLINNYDNAVKYNSEIFFGNLFLKGIAEKTIYLYTSDHGQSLLQGKPTHTNTTKNEAQIPLALISNKEDLPIVDPTYKASHANIFPTLLDFMKYPESERKYDYALSLLEAKAKDSKPRYYYAGDVFIKHNGDLYRYDP